MENLIKMALSQHSMLSSPAIPVVAVNGNRRKTDKNDETAGIC